jgi:hypothetical protein
MYFAFLIGFSIIYNYINPKVEIAKEKFSDDLMEYIDIVFENAKNQIKERLSEMTPRMAEEVTEKFTVDSVMDKATEILKIREPRQFTDMFENKSNQEKQFTFGGMLDSPPQYGIFESSNLKVDF